MSTQQITKNCLNSQLKFISKFIIPALLVASSSIHADTYQERMLFTPSESNLQAEARGFIMIYDGLKNETIERAMNEQFNRIENMMFVRTKYVQENGEYEADDDC